MPPLVYHPPEIAGINRHVRDMFERYRRTLPEERRVVLQRYHVVDVARKVVGVGSVGTRCAVALLMAGANDPLFLQFKQANESVLAPYAGKSRYENQGERVVTGQRMLQSASDVFLGWARGDDGRDYYFRQLRDMRMKIDISQMATAGLAGIRGNLRMGAGARARPHRRSRQNRRLSGKEPDLRPGRWARSPSPMPSRPNATTRCSSRRFAPERFTPPNESPPARAYRSSGSGFFPVISRAERSKVK